jgi:hypothetical protein
MAAGLSFSLPAAEPAFSLIPTVDNFQLGAAFAAIGDLNGDGTVDFAVSDPSYRSGGTLLGSGRVYLVSGADGTTLRSYETDPAQAQYFGLSLAALDADGDGIPDLAVGAPGHAAGSGAVRVYSGADGALLSMVVGVASSQFGSSLANAGDQDGDGSDDLFVGAPNANFARGSVTVQSGSGGGVLRTIASDVSFSQFGQTVAATGDLDGDGRAELVVGAPGFRSGSSVTGRVSLIRSSDDTALAQILGTGTYTRLGESLAPAADADGDGIPELMVGSYSGGVALLVSGADLATVKDLSLGGLAAFQPVTVGGSVDFDADGIADYLVGSPGLNTAVTPAAGGIRILSGADGSTLLEKLATSPISGLGRTIRVLPGLGFAAGESSLPYPATGGSGVAHVWQVIEDIVVADTDGDGVNDDLDAVPDSIMTATVAVLGIDSGVPNRVAPDGTTLADRFAALGPVNPRRPLAYLLSAARLLGELQVDRLVTRKEAARLTAATVVGMANAIRQR